jgi:molybdopterin-guanine dinucleotide biosynthesis protein A
LILAGGASRRFGRPKALIELADRPLIVYVADAIGSLADEVIVSVADSETERRIRPFLPEAVFARDERPASGPIEGFRQGFRVARSEVVIVAPCDAPFLRAPMYRLLLHVLGDYDAAVPKLDALDPVRAAYRRSPVLDALEADPGVPSPSALVDRLHSLFVSADQIKAVDPTLASFIDVNMPEDLNSALATMRALDE